VKAILHQLVRRYRWSVAPEYRMPVQTGADLEPPMGCRCASNASD